MLGKGFLRRDDLAKLRLLKRNVIPLFVCLLNSPTKLSLTKT